MGVTYFGAPALEFSTLLQVTEAGKIFLHESCTRPIRCIPHCFGDKGCKMGGGVKFMSLSSLPVCALGFKGT